MKSPFVVAFLDYLNDNGVDYVITSLHRIDDRDSEHYRGEAVDIACTTSRHRFKLLFLGFSFGCTRIGVYDKHIHFGFDEDRDIDVVWLGTSR